jgi:hypothetical protein
MSLLLLSYSNLNRYPEIIRHFSSTREGGVSSGEYASLNLGNYSDDRTDNIRRNKELLCNELNIPVTRLVGAHQVHGTSVKLVDENLVSSSTTDRTSAMEGYDALICRTPGICITATTADCVPVLLFDPVTKSIAAIHSGWRSTLNNITNTTIEAMQKAFGTDPAHLIAAIGPCISGTAYEVGEELQLQFETKDAGTDRFFIPIDNGKYLFDIRSVVRCQLQKAGVSDIEISEHCTFSEPELFFSARRQSIHSGRMLSGIQLL